MQYCTSLHTGFLIHGNILNSAPVVGGFKPLNSVSLVDSSASYATALSIYQGSFLTTVPGPVVCGFKHLNSGSLVDSSTSYATALAI
jgi:hypothetical protein